MHGNTDTVFLPADIAAILRARDWDFLTGCAADLETLGYPEEAEGLLVAAADAGFAPAAYNLGLLRLGDRRVEQGRHDLEQALLGGHGAAASWLADLAEEFGGDDWVKRARAYLLQGTRLRDTVSQVNLAILEQEEGNLEKAVSLLSPLAVVDAKYNWQLGDALLVSGERQLAEPVLLAALDAGERRASLELGNLYAADGRVEAAERLLREAVVAGRLGARHDLGVLLWRQGRRAEALETWKVDPSYSRYLLDEIKQTGDVLDARPFSSEKYEWSA